MSTPARKAQLISELREQRDALYAALERLPDADASRPIFTRDREGVSVCDELIRLVDAELAYRAWIEHARATQAGNARGPAPQEATVAVGDDASEDLAEVVDVLTLERRETLAVIRDLEPPDFLRTVQVPGATLTVDDLVAAMARHDRDLAGAITRRDGSLLPRFYARARSSGLERA